MQYFATSTSQLQISVSVGRNNLKTFKGVCYTETFKTSIIHCDSKTLSLKVLQRFPDNINTEVGMKSNMFVKKKKMNKQLDRLSHDAV